MALGGVQTVCACARGVQDKAQPGNVLEPAVGRIDCDETNESVVAKIDKV